jgi:hypothetical protein
MKVDYLSRQRKIPYSESDTDILQTKFSEDEISSPYSLDLVPSHFFHLTSKTRLPAHLATILSVSIHILDWQMGSAPYIALERFVFRKSNVNESPVYLVWFAPCRSSLLKYHKSISGIGSMRQRHKEYQCSQSSRPWIEGMKSLRPDKPGGALYSAFGNFGMDLYISE